MCSAWPDYELIDFGEGRKLERFGEWVLDRPAPAAMSARKTRPQEWRDATGTFVGDRAAAGEWAPAASRWSNVEQQLRVPLEIGGEFSLNIAPLPSGQIGVFPEQFDNWQWLARQVRRTSAPIKVLNLFAYTGGSTLALAAAGADVVHIDAAKSVVNIAGINVEASRLAERSVRRIAEDGMRFCEREVKRGNRYDAIVLDPPTYGHGPKGEEWNIKRDLLPLLELCGELTERRPKFVLLTCHSPGIGPPELSAYLSEGIFGACGQPPRTRELFLETSDGRRLPSGVYARWPG
jgi:23S rRNA (cytosine1962-C5)-methyltransferase